jgi:hypothetical protein
MSPFEVVQAIQSAGVGVVGLDSRRTVVVLRSVDDQDVGETVVILFRCVSQRIENFGGSHEGKEKRHPVTSATVARVRIHDERAGPPSSPIQTYRQSWISTAPGSATAAGRRELFKGLSCDRVLRRRVTDPRESGL